MTEAVDPGRPSHRSRARRTALRLAVLVVGPLLVVSLAASAAWGREQPAPDSDRALALGGPSEVPSAGLPAPTPAVTVGLVSAAGGRVRATEPVELNAEVSNIGAADAVGVRVTFYAAIGDAPPIAVGSSILDLAPGATGRAQVHWTPGAAGTWLVQVRVFGSEAVAASTVVRVAAAPDPDAEAVLVAQELPANALLGIVILLVVATIVSAFVGNRLLRR